jgi:hypothetical protein
VQEGTIEIIDEAHTSTWGFDGALPRPTLRTTSNAFRSDGCGIIFCKGSEGR